MTTYSVSNDQGYSEVFYRLSEAKKAMKEHNARCFATKIYSNGDWEPVGEIYLKGRNDYQMSNQKCKSYNQ